jgi:hypothetical protein
MPGSLASVLRRCVLSFALSSFCLFAITTAPCLATLVRRGPDVRWLFWFPANVRIAVLITARCPGLWLRSCAAVCCRSSYPLLASSPSQQRTRFSRPGVSPDRQYFYEMLSVMLFQLRPDVQPPCYGPAQPCVAVHPPCPRRVGCPGMVCRGRGRAAVYSGLSDRPFCNVIPVYARCPAALFTACPAVCHCSPSSWHKPVRTFPV